MTRSRAKRTGEPACARSLTVTVTLPPARTAPSPPGPPHWIAGC